jgi:cell division protease FtsH
VGRAARARDRVRGRAVLQPVREGDVGAELQLHRLRQQGDDGQDLNGRAAEIVVLAEPSTGASNDLLSATDLATRMVREWGFSTAVGPIRYGPEGPTRDNPFAGRPCAEETPRSIDQEVARLLREAEVTATKLIRENLDRLHRVIDLLLERETIDGADLAAVIEVPGQQDPPTANRRNRPATRTRLTAEPIHRSSTR